MGRKTTIRWMLGLLIGPVLAAGSPPQAGDQSVADCYIRKATWAETMLATRQACVYRESFRALEQVDIEALGQAVDDLSKTYPDRYPARHALVVGGFRRRLARYTKTLDQGQEVDHEELARFADEVKQWQRKMLLAHPLLDFDRLLVIRRNLGSRARQAMSREIGMASLNSHNNTSTASFQGLPCEGGSRPMAVLCLMNRDRDTIRQLTFEQDSDWCPTMLNNGRVLYLRWEYSDTPHYFSRILFHMNPDGTGQMEYLGSNSYFPNAYFYARPIPDHPTKVVGIVGGHHGISRSRRLLVFDPAQGRHEADGAVQEMPGRNKKIEPVIRDQLVNGVWPQFLHPYPLSDKYFLVSARPAQTGPLGVPVGL